MDKKFLLRRSTGDQPIATDADLRDAFQNGQCKAADFLFDFSKNEWCRAGEHPVLAAAFGEKPSQTPDRRLIYFIAPGGSAANPQGPFSTKEIQTRAQQGEICGNSWVFVEGDKEWRQVKNVKILASMLMPLPSEKPAAPVAAAAPAAPPRPAPVAPPAPAPAPVAAPAAPVELSLSTEDAPPPFASSAPPPFSLTPAPGASAAPSAPAASVEATPSIEMPSSNSIKLDLGMSEEAPPPKGPPAGATAGGAVTLSLSEASAQPKDVMDDSHVEREEITMALDTMGLNLHSEHAKPPPAPPKPVKAPAKPGIQPIAAKAPSIAEVDAPALAIENDSSPPKPPPPAAAVAAKDSESFDGIVAEIPMDPIWLVKRANSETVSGPFRFLEVIKFLEEGKLTKNDKIARTGNKAFAKILQQYEFNVKFSIENVIEKGVEKQKILIRRRHPRVPYMTGVQIVSKHGMLAGQCVNISAGGILMEVPKAEFNLGEIIEIKILPGLIAKSISCKSLIIGKIPKMPPGYALKFEDLKPEDKEAIEFYVQETLKREMSKKN